MPAPLQSNAEMSRKNVMTFVFIMHCAQNVFKPFAVTIRSKLRVYSMVDQLLSESLPATNIG